ncbi:MAG: hypothetical protein H7836_04615 [Magnetococcus sp. YQC-3]
MNKIIKLKTKGLVLIQEEFNVKAIYINKPKNKKKLYGCNICKCCSQFHDCDHEDDATCVSFEEYLSKNKLHPKDKLLIEELLIEIL